MNQENTSNVENNSNNKEFSIGENISAQHLSTDGAEKKGMSQNQIVRKRFLHHTAAMISVGVLAFIALIAYSSIGIFGKRGWWNKDWVTANPTGANGGAPTMHFSSSFPFFHLGEFPFGQDNLGHDFFSMTMRGIQQSFSVMIMIGLLSTLIGIFIGACSGYFGGVIDMALMRLTDMIITIPVLIIGAVLGKLVNGASALTLAVALSFVVWTSMARLVRAEFLRIKEMEFVDAAKIAGASNFRIIVKHILPNAIGVIIVNTTLLMSSAILLETALSFLGFGIQWPDVSLGNLISQNQNVFAAGTRQWLFWCPGLFIIIIALAINFIGDGLRDAFDPRQKRVLSREKMEKIVAKKEAKNAKNK